MHTRCAIWFGFRPNKSCTDSLLVRMHKLSQGLPSGASNWCIPLDISLVFDCSWPSKIIRALLTKRSPLYLIQIVEAFLHGRNYRLRIQAQEFIRATQAGTPQRSPLSPLLFLFLFDETLRLKTKGSFQGFADDLTLVVHQPFRAPKSTVKQ